MTEGMLATLGTVKDIHDEDDWAFEMKWDGIRAIATVRGGTLALQSRNAHDLTATYPELVALTDAVRGHDAVLDGEIVAIDRKGRPDFGLLQGRMNLSHPRDVEQAMRSIPVRYMLFDLLELDGHDWKKKPYDTRRAELEQLVRPVKDLPDVPPAFPGRLADAIETSRTLGLEGVVAKLRDSEYANGKRTRSWIKIKHHRAQEVLVIGWRPGNGRRADGIGSLLLGIPDGGGVRYVGRVGTGFTERMLAQIGETLATRARKTSPATDVPRADAADARWVRPDLVAEVEFAEWTSDGRLRQPVWRGWRPDKGATDIHLE